MPLSEHEQRMLDEMERNLYGRESDVHPARERMAGPNYPAVMWGVLVALAGLGVLIFGVMSQLIVLGIAGFAVLFAGAMLATRRAKATPGDASATANSAKANPTSRNPKGSGMSFMQRMEKRWDDRD